MGSALPPPRRFDAESDVLVIGAGACGLTAALAAREAGAEVVLERDASPSGSTSRSSGFVPAPGTRVQRAAGVADSPVAFGADIAANARGLNDPAGTMLAALDTPVITNARATPPHVDGTACGVRVERPEGRAEGIACRALVLACNGYGANRDMVAQHIPETAGAAYHGHPENTGDALFWGEALGAIPRHLSGRRATARWRIPTATSLNGR